MKPTIYGAKFTVEESIELNKKIKAEMDEKKKNKLSVAERVALFDKKYGIRD